MRPLATGFLLACSTAMSPVDATPVDPPTDPPAAEDQQYRAAEPYPGNDSGILRCESPKGRGRTCDADTRGGARLTKQLSRAPCIQHSTWSFDRTSVWVAQGCRADFQVGNDVPVASLGTQSVRCESDRGRERRCEVSVGNGAQMTRQLSKTPCVQGQTWGWDVRGVWVSRGCRADFAVW